MAFNRASLPALAMAAALGAGAGALTMALAGGDARQCREGAVATTGAASTQAAPRRVAAAFASPETTSAGARRPVPAGGHRIDAADGPPPPDVDAMLRDLLTLAWNDHRDMRTKLEDFLVEHPGPEGIAIASRGVFDLAGNRDVLPGTALAGLYLEQDDPAFRRVLAQVASLRGDNRLIELHVAEAGAGLHSTVAADRQRALVELARTRHVAAADLAAPLLADRDTGVVLDALLALRATGNQRHLAQVQGLRQHPDEAVRWLARDVATDLRRLSDQARTRIADSELSAELPPLPLPPANCGAAG